MTMQHFIKIGHTRYRVLSTFKMVAVRNLGFSNFQTFGHMSGWDG